MYPLLRPLLFRLDPERAHALTLTLLWLAGNITPARALLRKLYAPSTQTPVQAFGLTFPNSVGLAAGYDKDALAWRGLAHLGFGHIEVGTVTLNPQSGNPRPRVFRLPHDRAIINRMGFPGRGAAFAANRLDQIVGATHASPTESLKKGTPVPSDSNPILGVNIGKNKATPLEHAHNDYTQLLEIFAPLADYLTINVSSPNTLGLHRLQSREYLEDLLSKITTRRDALADQLSKPLPLLVKLSPDLSDADLSDALAVIQSSGVDGVIAANTTTFRPGLTSPHAAETGGLSGAPLTHANTRMIESIARHTQGSLPIVASGGVMSPQDAKDKLDAGSVLVQLYTGLIYRGPSLVKEIVSGISDH